MKITPDTNVLVRALTGDEPRQARLAEAALAEASVVALTPPALCELVWVLARGYRIPRAEIAAAIRRLMNSENVVVNRPAAEAGLVLLEAGGDFADGVIAWEGAWRGGETFVSFDADAVKRLLARGEAAQSLI